MTKIYGYGRNPESVKSFRVEPYQSSKQLLKLWKKGAAGSHAYTLAITRDDGKEEKLLTVTSVSFRTKFGEGLTYPVGGSIIGYAESTEGINQKFILVGNSTEPGVMLAQKVAALNQLGVHTPFKNISFDGIYAPIEPPRLYTDDAERLSAGVMLYERA